MYILLEGMPCTGKTTISKMLSQITKSIYLKSVVSSTKVGECLKELRKSNEKTLEFFYIIDGMLDELRVKDFLNQGRGIIRDKCFISSIAHILTHGIVNEDQLCKKSIWTAYQYLMLYSSMPDLVVLFEPDIEKIICNLPSKNDLSEIDKLLLSNGQLYMQQHDILHELLNKHFGGKLITIKSFNLSIEETCEYILNEYYKKIM